MPAAREGRGGSPEGPGLFGGRLFFVGGQAVEDGVDGGEQEAIGTAAFVRAERTGRVDAHGEVRALGRDRISFMVVGSFREG